MVLISSLVDGKFDFFFILKKYLRQYNQPSAIQRPVNAFELKLWQRLSCRDIVRDCRNCFRDRQYLPMDASDRCVVVIEFLCGKMCCTFGKGTIRVFCEWCAYGFSDGAKNMLIESIIPAGHSYIFIRVIGMKRQVLTSWENVDSLQMGHENGFSPRTMKFYFNIKRLNVTHSTYRYVFGHVILKHSSVQMISYTPTKWIMLMSKTK